MKRALHLALPPPPPRPVLMSPGHHSDPVSSSLQPPSTAPDLTQWAWPYPGGVPGWSPPMAPAGPVPAPAPAPLPNIQLPVSRTVVVGMGGVVGLVGLGTNGN